MSNNWYYKFHERIKSERRERYRSDPAIREAKRLQGIKYRRENSALLKERKAKYRERKRKELAAAQLARYYRNPTVAKAKNAARREKNRAKIRALSILRSKSLTDGYVREQLSKYSPLSTHEWPAEVVEAKKIAIQIKRELKRKKPIG